MQKTALRLIKNEDTNSTDTSATSSRSATSGTNFSQKIGGSEPGGSLMVGENLTVQALDRHAKDWLAECRYRQHSRRTIEIRSVVLEKLLWFLRERNEDVCGIAQIKNFLVYAATGHEEPGGRWGNPRNTKPVSARTLHTYYGQLRTFYGWLAREGVLSTSPMERIAAPVFRSDQVQPFTDEQVSALLEAARRSLHPRRDEAILLLLLDTGLRASELCSLRSGDLDLDSRRVQVLGKGNKRRTVYFGRRCAKALAQYLREYGTREYYLDGGESGPAVFCADRGPHAGEPLTRSGLRQLIVRLGRAAGIQAARCSPHTFRHTFAVSFLRHGGNVFSLQQMLGHTSLHMTNRYVALAQADLENQHRQFSPADRLGSGMR